MKRCTDPHTYNVNWEVIGNISATYFYPRDQTLL